MTEERDPRPENLREGSLGRRDFQYVQDLIRPIRKPNRDRDVLLMTQLMAERCLDDIVASRVSFPDRLGDRLSFDMKIRLCWALGGIAEREVHVCRVLQKARNKIVHEISVDVPAEIRDLISSTADSTDEEWRAQLTYLTSEFQRDLVALLAVIMAPWGYAREKRRHERFQSEIREFIRERMEGALPEMQHLIPSGATQKEIGDLIAEWLGPEFREETQQFVEQLEWERHTAQDLDEMADGSGFDGGTEDADAEEGKPSIS
jgi:hypothetical protein